MGAWSLCSLAEGEVGAKRKAGGAHGVFKQVWTQARMIQGKRFEFKPVGDIEFKGNVRVLVSGGRVSEEGNYTFLINFYKKV